VRQCSRPGGKRTKDIEEPQGLNSEPCATLGSANKNLSEIPAWTTPET
jgi:hypothetical protein